MQRATRNRWTLPSVGALMVGLFATLVSAEPIDVGHLIQASGLENESATIIVTRLSDGQKWVSNAERAEARFSPASTSKIPHMLIALEHALAMPETVFAWDGKVRSARVWNQDQTLSSAFRTSAVWVFQEIAQTAGPELMSDGLTDFDYGNADVGAKAQLTTYWLDDTLLISAAEQVAFLSRLAQRALPLTEATYATALAMMISDTGPNWVMRSKTGWRYSQDDMDIGWFVGWITCAEEVYIFALNIDMPDTRFLSKRQTAAYAVLGEIGAFDCD